MDDVGLLPVSADAAEGLFRVIDAALLTRNGRSRSPPTSTQSGFDELMPKSIATATVDPLLPHAHVLITESHDSYRRAQATAGKGVKPWDQHNSASPWFAEVAVITVLATTVRCPPGTDSRRLWAFRSYRQIARI